MPNVLVRDISGRMQTRFLRCCGCLIQSSQNLRNQLEECVWGIVSRCKSRLKNSYALLYCWNIIHLNITYYDLIVKTKQNQIALSVQIWLFFLPFDELAVLEIIMLLANDQSIQRMRIGSLEPQMQYCEQCDEYLVSLLL